MRILLTILLLVVIVIFSGCISNINQDESVLNTLFTEFEPLQDYSVLHHGTLSRPGGLKHYNASYAISGEAHTSCTVLTIDGQWMQCTGNNIFSRKKAMNEIKSILTEFYNISSVKETGLVDGRRCFFPLLFKPNTKALVCFYGKSIVNFAYDLMEEGSEFWNVEGYEFIEEVKMIMG